MANQSVIYTATRNLIAGRSLDDTVVTDIILRTKTRSRKTTNIQATTLSNRRFITNLNAFTIWRCATPPLNGADADLMREFLDSAADQTFNFDPNNPAGASPTDLRPVVMASNTYTESRAGQQADQADNYFTFAFGMEEVTA
jgi:hypothetical protein